MNERPPGDVAAIPRFYGALGPNCRNCAGYLVDANFLPSPVDKVLYPLRTQHARTQATKRRRAHHTRENHDKTHQQQVGQDNPIPFTGNYRGTTWNAQALLATDVQKRSHKLGRALSYFRKGDFLAIQETHSDKGKCKAFTTPTDAECYLPHENSCYGRSWTLGFH